MAEKQRMNLREWWDVVGTDNVMKIIERIGSNRQVFRQYRYGTKRPGVDRCQAIVELANEITPGFVPDLELLKAGVPMSYRTPGGRTIPPSRAFVMAARKRA